MGRETLKTLLDRLYETFDPAFLSSDPLEFVHAYKRDKDREIVGLIASSFAYGKVEGIKRSVSRILGEMGSSPHEFVMNFRPERDKKLFSGFVHRFNDASDVACLLWFTRQMIEQSGSIGAFFVEELGPEDSTIKEALISFSSRALNLDTARIYGTKALPKKAGVRFFFPSPSDKSPCKRLNLYLRWMARKDSLDFGIWKGVSPAKLIIPLDTHIERISRNIGLTKRKSADWKMAEEVTEALRALDPGDPVKYDFALCRLGILDICPKRRDPEKCASCLIKILCVL